MLLQLCVCVCVCVWSRRCIVCARARRLCFRRLHEIRSSCRRAPPAAAAVTVSDTLTVWSAVSPSLPPNLPLRNISGVLLRHRRRPRRHDATIMPPNSRWNVGALSNFRWCCCCCWLPYDNDTLDCCIWPKSPPPSDKWGVHFRCAADAVRRHGSHLNVTHSARLRLHINAHAHATRTRSMIHMRDFYLSASPSPRESARDNCAKSSVLCGERIKCNGRCRHRRQPARPPANISKSDFTFEFIVYSRSLWRTKHTHTRAHGKKKTFTITVHGCECV